MGSGSWAWSTGGLTLGEMCISFVLNVRGLQIDLKLFPREGLQEVRNVVPLHSQSREGYAPEAPAEVGASGSGKKNFPGCLQEWKTFVPLHSHHRPRGWGCRNRDHRHKDKTRASPFLEIRSERCELCKYKTRKQVVYQFSRWDSNSVTSSETYRDTTWVKV